MSQNFCTTRYYAISIQIEDFFNETSRIPMSSVPVQFLIHVLPAPRCSQIPSILPLTDCLEVQVGKPINLTLYGINYCNSIQSILTDISISIRIPSMNIGEMIRSTTNTSLAYRSLTWIPQINQIGTQQLCAIAYTSESVQSEEYCATFFVKNISNFCQSPITSTLITTYDDVSTLISSEEIPITNITMKLTESNTFTYNSTLAATRSTETTTKLVSKSGLPKLHLALIITFASIGLLVGYGCCCFGFYYLFYKRKHRDDSRE